MRRHLVGVGLVLVALVGCSGDGGYSGSAGGEPAEPAGIPTALAASRIFFVSTRDGNQEVYVMRADGSGATNLTRHPAHDFAPAVSLDGTRIAFASDRAGPAPGLFAMAADGSRLAGPLADAAAPGAISPDGRQVAFTRDACSSESSIWRVNADGSGLTRLVDNDGVDRVADWR